MREFDDLRRAWAVARRQHGVIGWGQLVECGLTRSRVDWLVARGELRRLHRGVYLAGPLASRHASEMAAVLACGVGAAVSHGSAVCLYGLLPYPAHPGPTEITVAGRRRAGDGRIVVHRTASLRPHEIRERHGIPVTGPPRTLIDFASQADWDVLESVVAEAFALRLTNRSQLLRALDAAAGRRGVTRLRELLDGERGPARTRSGAERRLLALVRRAGLPEPEVNARVGRWEVDLFWREQGLAVELDVYSTHSSPRAFERDRRKTAELEDRGLAVQRITPHGLRDGPEDALRRIARELG